MSRTNRDRIGTDAEKAGVAKADLSGETHEQIEACNRQRKNENERADAIVVCGWKEPRQVRQRPRQPLWAAATGTRAVCASSNPLDFGPAKQALGNGNQHNKDDKEGDCVLIVRRDIAGSQCLGHSDQNTAHYCSRSAAQFHQASPPRSPLAPATSPHRNWSV